MDEYRLVIEGRDPDTHRWRQVSITPMPSVVALTIVMLLSELPRMLERWRPEAE
jgi:hypothetical protein